MYELCRGSGGSCTLGTRLPNLFASLGLHIRAICEQLFMIWQSGKCDVFKRKHLVEPDDPAANMNSRRPSGCIKECLLSVWNKYKILFYGNWIVSLWTGLIKINAGFQQTARTSSVSNLLVHLVLKRSCSLPGRSFVLWMCHTGLHQLSSWIRSSLNHPFETCNIWAGLPDEANLAKVLRNLIKHFVTRLLRPCHLLSQGWQPNSSHYQSSSFTLEDDDHENFHKFDRIFKKSKISFTGSPVTQSPIYP